MYGLKIKTTDNREPYLVEKARSVKLLEARATWFKRLAGIEYAEIINLNPPKGGGRDAQKA
jgi:hypothetical protein